MFKPSATIIAAATTLAVACKGMSAESLLPQATVELADKALELAGDRSLPAKNPAAFAAALDKLVPSLDPTSAKTSIEQEAKDIRAKTAFLALSRSEHPLRFRNVLDYYFNNVPAAPSKQKIARAVERAPDLLPEHATEEYRPAWEFCLLIAWFSGAPEQWQERTIEALTKIGNPRSAIVLGRRISEMATDPRADANLMITALVRIPSDESLKALLRSIEAWEVSSDVRKQGAANLLPGLGPNCDARTNAVEAFKVLKAEEPEKLLLWRDTMDGYPKEGISKEQNSILASLQYTTNLGE